MEKEFQSAYRGLNPAQKEAVDTIDGPVLVIAGPGTGKTQLLSLRVANILKKTDTDPASILCLTFTNFAATNMRNRLGKLVGPMAKNVNVRTFHSFAAEIINLYPDYFWNGARLEVAPDAVQLELIQSILDGLPLDNPLALKFAGNYTAIHDVQQALKLAKEAGLSPEKLTSMLALNNIYIDLIEPKIIKLLSQPLSIKRLSSLQTAIDKLPDQLIDEHVTPLVSLSTVIKESLANAIQADLIEGKTTQTGRWKRRWLQTVDGKKGMFDERRRQAWWSALSGVYAKYRDQLHQQGYYDYSDMIIEVITQLEQSSELRASVQERFLYVLIDEFQDSNAAQLRLAHLIASHPSTEGRPNLMAVGDDDQSIFAFNGAELSNMLAFRRTYPETITIVLTENYRSTQAVLNLSQSIIEQAEDRLVKRDPNLTKILKASASPPKGKIEHRTYPTHEHQLQAIAQRIKQAWKAENEDNIAVLARQHSSLQQLSAILNNLSVSIQYEKQNNVLDQPLIQQIIILGEIAAGLKEGDESTVNHYIPILLQNPLWQVSPEQIWQLAVDNFANPHWLDSLKNSNHETLKILNKWFIWLSQQIDHEPLQVMLEYLIGLRASEHMTSPLRQHFLANQKLDNKYLEGLSAVQTLLTTAYEFTAARSSQTNLSDFIRLVRLHRQLDRPITDESWFQSGEKAIQLMTVHKAKGLEFDIVFLIDAVDTYWQPRRIGRKPPANLPLQPYGEVYDDYVRLFYVAATRAKHSLIVSSFTYDKQGKLLLPTPLINALPASEEAEDRADSIEVLEQALSWPRLETTDEKRLLQKRFDNFQLSSTAFLSYLDVVNGGPQHFFERHLLKIPELRTANMAYGTAIHRALQVAQQLSSRSKFNLRSVLKAYRDSLKLQQLQTTEINRYLEHGEATLNKLFKDRKFKLDPTGQPEISLSDINIGKARVRGQLDRINLRNKDLQISDYKTGKPLTDFNTSDQAKAIKAWRQRNQLIFYILLARNSQRFQKIENFSAQLIYVEAENQKNLTLSLQQTDQEEARLAQLINIVWRKIMNLDFPDTRHYAENIAGIRNFEDDLINDKI